MIPKFYKIAFVLLLSIFVANCTSVTEYNKEMIQPIAVAKLQHDINYTQHKLEKYYPNLYGYISKEKLDFKFDSIRKVVNHPMTPKEFYFVISPVIASVRQGHMNMSLVMKKSTKKERKKYKNRDGPFSQFDFEWENNKLFVIKNKSKNKNINLGAEVISINTITPQQLFDKYRKTMCSDGFNETYIRRIFRNRLSNYLVNEIGINDSLTYVFKQNDSIFSTVVARNKLEKKGIASTESKLKDSIKTVEKQPIDKAKLKAEKKHKKVYGYDVKSKEYVRCLKYVNKDSSVAVLRIKHFSDGKYKKAYSEIFDSIKRKKCKTLIIDLRDNPGGHIADIVNLYSYLTNKEYTLIKPVNVTSKTSLWKAGMFKEIPKITYPLAAVFYPFYMGFSTLRTTKNKEGNYQVKIKGSKPLPCNSNHFDGKIYVLINGGSFSASCILSTALKSNPNVTFVGEETGGAFNGCVAGVMPIVDLPNSKILLRLGLMDTRAINQTEVIGRGIFPDKEIIQTVQNKVDKKDPEMDWILEDIQKSL